MQELHSTFAALWVVWFFLMFGFVLFRTLRPARRAAQEQASRIPLREDD